MKSFNYFFSSYGFGLQEFINYYIFGIASNFLHYQVCIMLIYILTNGFLQNFLYMISYYNIPHV